MGRGRAILLRGHAAAIALSIDIFVAVCGYVAAATLGLHVLEAAAITGLAAWIAGAALLRISERARFIHDAGIVAAAFLVFLFGVASLAGHRPTAYVFTAVVALASLLGGVHYERVTQISLGAADRSDRYPPAR